ncbi:ComEA family DNA-binding protein [Flagellimonas okinawensis]|uniref:Helix-hairpin-helix domain-containing protein n=1 Tax=Flagellimonas okinawensis TaxID=3031324 RepID=A0ABT5XQQ8_9FLAO|nr:helix-hairpin-helix domain-containing protein [[Muricauda] okinawensis]MDF0708224.1 helix-hairpin-helix domain-containing protein [[Muricauda] okinawensis]
MGLSTAELDRLFVFRNQGKFVNSAEEFQEVTKISDTLLKTIAPYFKFPDWVSSVPSTTRKHQSQSKTKVLVKDLNTATASDLMAVYGIGETLSKRIVKFRDRLGGFLVDEQLYDVYGLKPEVVQKTLLKFKVKEVPTIKRININKASAEELAQLVYIPKSLAYNIVEYRGLNGVFRSFQDLKNIEKFPSEKLDRIALYLSL